MARLNDLKIITDKILMKRNKKMGFSLILSLFFHTSLIVSLMVWKSDKERPEKPLVKVEWVEFVSSGYDNKQPLQIVDQEENIDGSIPEKNYRLSHSHRDLLKETRVKRKGDFKNVKKKWKNSQKLQNLKTEKPKMSLNDLKPGFSGPISFRPVLFENSGFYEREKTRKSKLDPYKKTLLPGKSGQFNHSQPSLEKNSGSLGEETSFSQSGFSQTDDYLKDVALGSRTLLRTREFVYYSYYSRIKKKLKYHWEPKIKVKMVRAFHQGRRIAGVNDRITRLVIILNQSGGLKKIHVENSSGFRELDEASIEAFKEASPFPNPPVGLVNESGEVKIHWDFVLETDKR